MDNKEFETIKNRLLTEKHHNYDSLTDLVRLLRSENGCPWDKEQTHASIRKDLIEETYEVIEGIDRDDPHLMCEELGDLMMQAVFHADIENDAGRFTPTDVFDGIVNKMILRHPHVFGDVQADTSEKVLENWDKIKAKEKDRPTVTSKMDAIPPALPALMRAHKIGKAAAKVGFDFPDAYAAFDKIGEESDEVAAAMKSGDKAAVKEELGDLLFAVVNVCRLSGVDAEEALTAANDKFVSRFRSVEESLTDRGLTFEECDMAFLDSIWDENKQKCLKNGEKIEKK